LGNKEQRADAATFAPDATSPKIPRERFLNSCRHHQTNAPKLPMPPVFSIFPDRIS
jgi:hypothetical protein